jgi:6-pyruvoyltetrahydropterin/6-carboxytetrahydropterin synthase
MGDEIIKSDSSSNQNPYDFKLEGEDVYEVTVKKSFSAAHVIDAIGGKCETLHGHNFAVEVSISGAKLNAEGLLVDFRVLKQWTDEVLDTLDHKYLNDIEYFKDVNPSSEHIARFIHDKIAEKARGYDFEVTRVTVWESENARVSYSGTRQ